MVNLNALFGKAVLCLCQDFQSVLRGIKLLSYSLSMKGEETLQFCQIILLQSQTRELYIFLPGQPIPRIQECEKGKETHTQKERKKERRGRRKGHSSATHRNNSIQSNIRGMRNNVTNFIF